MGLGAALGAGCGNRAKAPAAARAAATPTRKASGGAKSRVVLVRHSKLTNEKLEPNAQACGKALEVGLLALTGESSVRQAWRRFVKPEDTVALKVNCLAGPPLATHPELAYAVVESMARAGLPEENAIIFDRDSGELEFCGYELRASGRGPRCFGSDAVGYEPEPTIVLSTGTCYSLIVTDMATAIINLPILKDHDLAGLSAALKNHFGSVHNPNKMHTNRCCPAVADVNCAEHIRGKQRLVVCDALLVCYYGGPGYKPETTVRYNALLLGTDPVAVDAVGTKIIEELRAKAGKPSLAEEELWPNYLEIAADDEHRLGQSDLNKIELLEVDAETV